MHKSTAAMKNTPKILIVSITKLLIELSIIVQKLVVNNVAFLGGSHSFHSVGRTFRVQNYYVKLPKVVSTIRKMQKKCNFLRFLLKMSENSTKYS